MSEFDYEPVPGVPGDLPAGERILLQVRPAWRAFAIHVFHARKIAIYCAALVVWRIGAGLAAGKGLGVALLDGAWIAPLAVAGVLIPVLLAWIYARTSIYTITDRRVILRTGAAMPMSFNLPYRQIDSAALRLYSDGAGDIPLKLKGGDRLAYAHLWPHVRPWRFAQPEPMLRAVPDAQKTAGILSAALRDAQLAAPSATGQRTGDARPVSALVTAAA